MAGDLDGIWEMGHPSYQSDLHATTRGSRVGADRAGGVKAACSSIDSRRLLSGGYRCTLPPLPPCRLATPHHAPQSPGPLLRRAVSVWAPSDSGPCIDRDLLHPNADIVGEGRRRWRGTVGILELAVMCTVSVPDNTDHANEGHLLAFCGYPARQLFGGHAHRTWPNPMPSLSGCWRRT